MSAASAGGGHCSGFHERSISPASLKHAEVRKFFCDREIFIEPMRQKLPEAFHFIGILRMQFLKLAHFFADFLKQPGIRLVV